MAQGDCALSSSAANPATASKVGRAGKFAALFLELVLIAVIVHLFEIELYRRFLPVFCFIVAGFAVHVWLPDRYRLLFFAALSVSSVPFVAGLGEGGCVLAAGAALIGICYLPLPWRVRIVLLVAVGSLLVIWRAKDAAPFWPIIGSCFMFRLLSFVYEAQRRDSHPSLAAALAYFFMVPNACFPFFPVVDYRVFQETRYNEDEWAIYQRGVAWMVRGLAHLLLYRFVRNQLLPETYELYRLSRVVAFMAANYALYLQVSGQFHLITGLLHLFGWNLPRTHNCYFLASSFSDIWRRINIYWKDYLAKFVFYPVFYAFRARGSSALPAMFAGAVLVFVATWILHSWQTFWLLGRFPLTVNDACLWLGAGLAVAVNLGLESRHGSSRPRSGRLASFRLGVQIVLMQLLISLFWACWTKPGFLQLAWSALHRREAAQEAMIILPWLLAAAVVATAALWLDRSRTTSGARFLPVMDLASSIKLHLAALGVGVAVALPWSASLLPPDWSQAIAAFRQDPVFHDVAGARLQGYYEDLNQAVIQAGPLIAAVAPQRPVDPARAEGFNKVTRAADLYLHLDLIPGLATEIDGKRFSVNEYGMRDRRGLTFDKPPGVVRIALVGSSIVMGYGVADDEVFSRRFESKLNRILADSSRRVEVLNFGVGKQWAPHRLVRIQRKVLAFQPDALFYFAHQDELRQLANHAAQLVAQRLELPSQHLKAVVERAGVRPEMAPGAILAQLSRRETELLSAVYQSIVEECRQRRIAPVWIYLPVPGATEENVGEKLRPISQDAGFIVCDLSDWTSSRDGLFQGPDDPHPNAAGHDLIAEALVNMLRRRPEALPGLTLDELPAGRSGDRSPP